MRKQMRNADSVWQNTDALQTMDYMQGMNIPGNQ